MSPLAIGILEGQLYRGVLFGLGALCQADNMPFDHAAGIQNAARLGARDIHTRKHGGAEVHMRQVQWQDQVCFQRPHSTAGLCSTERHGCTAAQCNEGCGCVAEGVTV